MILFTSAFVARLERTYKGTLNPIVGLATLPHNEELRIRIEEWLIDIPEAAQVKLVKKFKTDHENTASYVVELLVGSMLARRGFNLQYEPQFGTQTPDWLIVDDQGKRAVVEVLNLNMPEDTKSEWQQVSDIHSKLSKYPQPVAFSVRCKSLFMDESEFEEVGRWLSSRPSEGQVLRTANAELEIAYWNEKYTHAQPIGPSASYWGRPDRLEIKIKEKVSNYSSITEQGLPLILAFKTESLTGVDFEDIHKILLGQSIQDECKYFHEGVVTFYSNLDGLYYTAASNLFGFIWIAGDFTAPQASFIQNPRSILKTAFNMNWQSRLLLDS